MRRKLDGSFQFSVFSFQPNLNLNRACPLWLETQN
jgi:hypothetical protein